MSMDINSEIYRAQIAYTCTYCGAEPYEPCVTSGGRWAAHLHAPRFYQWRDSVNDE
jgi:hypothetical protein